MAAIITIGQYIKSAREERGFTQWEVCEELEGVAGVLVEKLKKCVDKSGDI